MSSFMLFLLMICAGATVAIQPAINARLAQKVGLLESATISFAVGTLVLLVAVFSLGRGDWRGVTETVWWEWSGGLLGAFFVSSAIFAVPRIGTAATMAAVIAAQLSAGLIMDHFGLFGFRAIPIDVRRLIGIVFLMFGAALMFRR